MLSEKDFSLYESFAIRGQTLNWTKEVSPMIYVSLYPSFLYVYSEIQKS